MKKYHLIPMSLITDDAREIAVAWVENFQDGGGIMIEQKHKLASDIMNYAANNPPKTATKDQLEDFCNFCAEIDSTWALEFKEWIENYLVEREEGISEI